MRECNYGNRSIVKKVVVISHIGHRTYFTDIFENFPATLDQTGTYCVKSGIESTVWPGVQRREIIEKLNEKRK